MNEESTAYTGWAVVELMGRRRYAGLVSEVVQYGKPMGRLDVPETPEAPATTIKSGLTALHGRTTPHGLRDLRSPLSGVGLTSQCRSNVGLVGVRLRLALAGGTHPLPSIGRSRLPGAAPIRVTNLRTCLRRMLPTQHHGAQLGLVLSRQRYAAQRRVPRPCQSRYLRAMLRGEDHRQMGCAHPLPCLIRVNRAVRNRHQVVPVVAVGGVERLNPIPLALLKERRIGDDLKHGEFEGIGAMRGVCLSQMNVVVPAVAEVSEVTGSARGQVHRTADINAPIYPVHYRVNAHLRRVLHAGIISFTDSVYQLDGGGESVYQLSPVSEEAARAVCRYRRPEPVHVYELTPPSKARALEAPSDPFMGRAVDIDPDLLGDAGRGDDDDDRYDDPTYRYEDGEDDDGAPL